MKTPDNTLTKGGFREAALSYLDRGWTPIPIRPRSKDPLIKWKPYQEHPPTADEITAWGDKWPDANVGILTGAASGTIAVDIDSAEGEENLRELVGDVATPTNITANGRHPLFQHPGFPVGNSVRLLEGIDIRADGGYIVAPPSIHPSGHQYHWDEANGRGLDCPLAPLPAPLLDLIYKSKEADTDREPAKVEPNHEPFRLPTLIERGNRNHTLYRYGCSLRSRGSTRDEIQEALDAANEERCKAPLDGDELARIVRSAAQHVPEVGREHLTDLGNARRLVEWHGPILRYVAELRAWYVWNGYFWERDHTGEVVRRAKRTIGQMYADAQAVEDSAARKKLVQWALRSESDARIRSMIELARTEEDIGISVRELDHDNWVLNVENGIIDLYTGELHEHDPEFLLTKVAPVKYDPDATAPQWHAFLRRVTGKDEELMGYIQRLVGYSLTGDVSEQLLVFLHGYGANGKTTFLNTVLELLGPYAKQADPQLLMAHRNDAHPTGIADLHGSRMVVCSEVDEGRPMAEATVKQLTGGDRVKARFMRQDFFEFEPTHKIWLAANHRPVVKGTDYAIWRRIKLVPFTVTIPDHQQDRQLAAKLRAEHPGILAWAVRGCLSWQLEGLRQPDAVRHATDEYRSEMDLIAQFIEERCEVDAAAEVTAKSLYEAYRVWCAENGLHPSVKQSFGRRIVERAHRKRKSTGGQMVYEGIRLK